MRFEFSSRSKPTKTELIVIALFCLVLVLLLLPAVEEPRGDHGRSSCKNNLKQIGLALHNYHDTWLVFPPAYLADENGQPMHSWRVLILPFLDRQDLYDQYDFNEPWDGPHNSQLVDQVPSVYRCPQPKETQEQEGDSSTDYVALVGTGAAFAENDSRRITDFKDGTSDTAMVIELGASDINWMEPRDVEVRNVMQMRAAEPHWSGTHILRADGSVRFLPSDINPAIVEALITISGGEEIPEDWR